MPDGHALGYQSLIAAAESAAAAGDLSRTETLFRQAILAQEQELGPAHPGLASTCNNLAVVCERAGHLDDAEYFYRRAYAIAVSLLDAKDPLVSTSFDNLKAFCESQGLPLDDWPDLSGIEAAGLPTRPRAASLATAPRRSSPSSTTVSGESAGADVADLFGVYAAPAVTLPTGAPRSPAPPLVSAASAAAMTAPPLVTTAVPVADAAPSPATLPTTTSDLRRPSPAAGRPVVAASSPPSPAAPPARSTATASSPAPPATSARPPLSRPIATASGIAVVLAIIAVLWPSSRERDSVSDMTGTAAATTTGSADAASTVASVPSTDVTPTPIPPAKIDRSPEAKSPAPVTAAVTPSPARADRTQTPVAGLRLVTASLCATLDTRARPWRCVAVGDGGASGPVTYFTRIATAAARTRVEHRWYQGDTLRLTRALTIGYSPTEGYRTYSRYTPAPGEWRVELVAADGTVMNEARFVAR